MNDNANDNEQGVEQGVEKKKKTLQNTSGDELKPMNTNSGESG
jgi:hypothetical protein